MSIFFGDPGSTLGVGAWEGSNAWGQEKKCEDKALEIKLAYGKWNRNQGALVP